MYRGDNDIRHLAVQMGSPDFPFFRFGNSPVRLAVPVTGAVPDMGTAAPFPAAPFAPAAVPAEAAMPSPPEMVPAIAERIAPSPAFAPHTVTSPGAMILGATAPTMGFPLLLDAVQDARTERPNGPSAYAVALPDTALVSAGDTVAWLRARPAVARA